MQPSIRIVFNLCRFAAKPQDLPTSTGFLVMCVLGSFAGYQLGNSLLTESATGVMLISLAQTALLGAGLWLLLMLYRRPQRWPQAATALYGACAVTHLAALPMILWASGGAQPLTRLSGPMWGIAAFRIWFFAIIVYILKETLEISVGLAAVIALVMQLLFAIALTSLFGAQLG